MERQMINKSSFKEILGLGNVSCLISTFNTIIEWILSSGFSQVTIIPWSLQITTA